VLVEPAKRGLRWSASGAVTAALPPYGSEQELRSGRHGFPRHAAKLLSALRLMRHSRADPKTRFYFLTHVAACQE
jgi:hypothetical protein